MKCMAFIAICHFENIFIDMRPDRKKLLWGAIEIWSKENFTYRLRSCFFMFFSFSVDWVFDRLMRGEFVNKLPISRYRIRNSMACGQARVFFARGLTSLTDSAARLARWDSHLHHSRVAPKRACSQAKFHPSWPPLRLDWRIFNFCDF